jgi:hypothetical protein
MIWKGHIARLATIHAELVSDKSWKQVLCTGRALTKREVYTKGLGMHSRVLMALISGGEEYMRVLKIVNQMQ